jgi:hypothetical protein
MPQPVDLASTVLVALVDIEEVILMSMQIKSVNILMVQTIMDLIVG